MVVDALSRLSMNNVAHVDDKKRDLVKDEHSMAF